MIRELSPGLKRYLAHFDAYLRASSAADERKARQAMRDELANLGIEPREDEVGRKSPVFRIAA